MLQGDYGTPDIKPGGHVGPLTDQPPTTRFEPGITHLASPHIAPVPGITHIKNSMTADKILG